MNGLAEIKGGINLIEYVRTHYSLKIDDNGKCSCPFHPPDNNSSFSIFKAQDGTWRWKDFHDGATGSIIDLVSKLENVTPDDALHKLFKEFAGDQPREQKPKPAPLKSAERKLVREHIYKDATGRSIFKKLRFEPKDWETVYFPGKDKKDAVPYRLEEFKNHSQVVVCEGERDVDMVNVLDAGVFATSAPWGKGSWPKEITPYFSDFKQILFLYDIGNDEDVKKHAAKLHAAFPETEIFIAHVPGDIPDFDITDYLETQQDKKAALLGILEKIEILYPEPAPLSLLSEIAPVEVPWLWKNFIPLGRASMISGDPGSGKTFFALDLSARVSRGLPWPDGAEGEKPGNVIYLTIEDDPSDTLRPRLDSLGGDAARVNVLNLDRVDFLDLSSEKGLKTLEGEIRRIGNIRFVIIDPILDFSGKINPNAAQEVRSLLNPLINLAVKFSFSLLLIAHLNKSQSMAAIYRTSGATAAWLGKCRASFLIFRDREDPAKRYFIPLKANLSPEDPPQLCFRLINGQVIFEKLEEKIDIEEHIALQRQPIEADSSFVSEWLKETLKDGPVELKEILRQSKDADIPRASLFRKKKAFGIQSKISGVGKFRKAVWFLPGKEI